MLFTHANIKGFGLASLSGARRGYMPPQLKTNSVVWTPMDTVVALMPHTQD